MNKKLNGKRGLKTDLIIWKYIENFIEDRKFLMQNQSEKKRKFHK